MGSSLSRAGSASGRSLAGAQRVAREAPITVKLSEKALKPQPKGAKELQRLSSERQEKLPQHIKSEYAIETEDKDLSLDGMLSNLGDSLTRRSINLYDQSVLDTARMRHKEKMRQGGVRVEPATLITAFQQYYQERDAGQVDVQAIAARHGIEPAAFQKIVDTTCLPAVRNEAGEMRGARTVGMIADWR